ncbi:hypothetical protein E1N66_05325 [Pantoea allii]|nr:GTPase-associated system all-helical protein GASH [Pantoea allii]THB85383.1 hypothetical protein E1N66_05325 [Pantoea allii]
MDMSQFTFADRYSEAGLAPTAEKIQLREAPVSQIVENIEDKQIVVLAQYYYGQAGMDMTWFRDAFAEADASFSLVNNEREARVLSALALGRLIHEENSKAILAVSIGSVRGLRKPSQSEWLVYEAEKAFLRCSVNDRSYASLPEKVSPTENPKLPEELKAVAEAPDLTTVIALLSKVREEMRSSAQTTARQVSNAINACNRQLSVMREESQMLWWLTGGHSKTLSRSFAALTPAQAALVGALDLGMITTSTHLGPVAIPAMLEKIMAMAKKARTVAPATVSLQALIDSFTAEEIETFDVPESLPPFLAPFSAAIERAKTIGPGGWHARFTQHTGLDASLSLAPVILAEQLYREILLGQLM